MTTAFSVESTPKYINLYHTPFWASVGVFYYKLQHIGPQRGGGILKAEGVPTAAWNLTIWDRLVACEPPKYPPVTFSLDILGFISWHSGTWVGRKSEQRPQFCGKCFTT